MNPFVFTRTPRILFGNGKSAKIGETISGFGSRALIVVGRTSFEATGVHEALDRQLHLTGIDAVYHAIRGEPSPEMVDEAARAYRDREFQVVCAIGGGSTIDAGKAISAMIPQSESVMEFIEGMGTRRHDGRKIPFVAVPTTAGTGSEATKNAVLSRVGPAGFKRSLRHDNFVPDAAIVDPALTKSCPDSVTAACGMDAFTQLLESYTSSGASALTDALALSGLELLGDALFFSDPESRSRRSYAALVSGITLANAGLGVVHSFAASIGGLFDIPHGVLCGALVGPATSANVEALIQRGADHPALAKYARVGALVGGIEGSGLRDGCDALVHTIREWTRRFGIPRLGTYGVREKDIGRIVDNTTLKTNPIDLTAEELAGILRQVL